CSFWQLSRLWIHPLPNPPRKGEGARRLCGTIVPWHRAAPSPAKRGEGRGGGGDEPCRLRFARLSAWLRSAPRRHAMFETIAEVDDPSAARVLVAALKAHGFHPLEGGDSGLP